MKIGDEVYVHGYVDEIRKDVVIIRNEGGYFGTDASEVILADRKTENSSEKPNNSLDKDTNVRSKPNDCKYAVNPSGDVWECGCCLEIFCEHQIYDRNPDGTLNIVECGFEPKAEPQSIDMFVLDMAVAKCKAQHDNCRNCDKKCVFRNGINNE